MLCNDSRTRHSRRQGFSLVELMVVMVILGMLAGLVAVKTRGFLIAGNREPPGLRSVRSFKRRLILHGSRTVSDHG